jgi:hypothetical protein
MKHLASISLILLSITACTPTSQAPINLSLDVKAGSRPGIYEISGNTNLPDQSRLSVVGIRYLKSPSTFGTTPIKLSTYSLLARQPVEVSQNRWQTTLTLWQPRANGQYQEAWQTQQNRQFTQFSASEDVSFIAIFEPTNQTPQIQKQIQEKHLELDANRIRLTDAGQPYLQVQRVMPVSIPVGNAIAIKTQENSDWGDRATLKAQPAKGQNSLPLPKGQQTDAPLSNSEILR